MGNKRSRHTNDGREMEERSFENGTKGPDAQTDE